MVIEIKLSALRKLTVHMVDKYTIKYCERGGIKIEWFPPRRVDFSLWRLRIDMSVERKKEKIQRGVNANQFHSFLRDFKS